MYALIKNGVVDKYPYSVTDLRFSHPNVSFPPNPDDDALAAFGLYPVKQVNKPVITATQIVEEQTPIFSNGEWTQVWSVRDMTQEESDAMTAGQAASVRAERNAKLAASDWTQVIDAPVDQAAWATYRQALRDITSQAGFPWDIQWPAQP